MKFRQSSETRSLLRSPGFLESVLCEISLYPVFVSACVNMTRTTLAFVYLLPTKSAFEILICGCISIITHFNYAPWSYRWISKKAYRGNVFLVVCSSWCSWRYYLKLNARVGVVFMIVSMACLIFLWVCRTFNKWRPSRLNTFLWPIEFPKLHEVPHKTRPSTVPTQCKCVLPHTICVSGIPFNHTERDITL